MPKDPLQIAKDALARAIETEQRNQRFMESIGPAVIAAVKPVLDEILSVFKETSAKVDKAIAPEITFPEYPDLSKLPAPQVNVSMSDIKVPEIKVPDITVPAPQVTVNVPEIKVPEAKVTVDIPKIVVPEPKVTVNVPKIVVPNLSWPEGDMPINGWVRLMGIDYKNPLPVRLFDADGKPAVMGGGPAIIGGGGGPGVKVLNTSSEPVPISGTISATFSADFGQGATGSQTLRTVAATDSIQSVNIVSGSSSGTEYADGAVRGTATGTLLMLDDGTNIQSARGGAGNADSRTMRVVHASDAIVSVNIVSGSSSGATGQGDAASALRVVVAGNSDASVSVNQWNGNTLATGLNETTNGVLRTVLMTDSTVSTNVVSFNGSAPAQGLNETNTGVLRTVLMTDSVVSVYANNPVNQGDAATALRVVVAGNSDVSVTATQTGTWTVALSGALTSAAVIGDSAARTADNGGNPVKIGGIARTTNPTAYADGDRANFSADKMGRQLVRPLQVRELLATAYASITNGTETTLATATAGGYLDLVYMMATNNSDAAVTVDIRAVSAGNIMTSIRVPANGTAGVSLPIPLPQDATGNAWTADLPDITGTTVTISALFSKEL